LARKFTEKLRAFMDAIETISNYWDWRSQNYTNGAYGFQEEEKAESIRTLVAASQTE
jgi:hypothetical protein